MEFGIRAILTNINESYNQLNKEKLILCYLTQNMYHGYYLGSWQ